MRQVADCVPYQGKNTYFCPGVAQVVSTSIIYNRRFRPFSNDIVKQPTATTWILGAYISFCGTNCATLGSKHPFSPWCGTQSRTRPLHKSHPAICEPQPSPRPCQNRAWHRAKSARRRDDNIYRRTSKTHTAHVLVIRPHEHTMFAQALAAGKASHESTQFDLAIARSGLSRRAGRQRANHNDLPGIRLHGHIPAVADADPVQIRRQSPLIPPCVFSPQRVAQRNIPAPGCGEHAKYAGTV